MLMMMTPRTRRASPACAACTHATRRHTPSRAQVGCKFFLLFHTGFVQADGALPVPLRMMDKAFKTAGKKKSKYRGDGEATLRMSKVVGGVARASLVGDCGRLVTAASAARTSSFLMRDIDDVGVWACQCKSHL